MRSRSLAVFTLVACAGCGLFSGDTTVKRSPLAEKWLTRAQSSYKAGDFEDAKTSAAEGLKAGPHDEEIRIIGARVALAKLDLPLAIHLTEGLTSADACGLRGRAHWYAGDLEQAADDLEAELQDPAVKDPWARDVAKLARSGNGRHPFAIEGGIIAEIDMPQAGSALIVPLELDGQRVLGMVATGSSEVVIDSGARKDPQWISLRLGDRIEVKDVPAVPQDLSPLSRQVGGTIKVLLGVNFLRHTHATFDRRGSQFVIRQSEPSAPPDASRVPLFYVKGGGLLMRASLSPKEDGTGLLYADSSQGFMAALADGWWKRAGVDPKSLVPASTMANAKSATLPYFKIGGFDFPGVPAFAMSSLGDRVPEFDVDLAGVLGASILEFFRLTFADEGRFAWLEPDPTLFTTTPPAPKSPNESAAPPPDPSKAPPATTPNDTKPKHEGLTK